MTSDSKSALKSNVESLISDGNEAHAGLILVSEDVEFFKLQGYQFCYSENNTHSLESEVKTTLKKTHQKTTKFGSYSNGNAGALCFL